MKRLAALCLAAMSSAAAAAVAELDCQGPVEQGGFLICRTAPGASLRINGDIVTQADADGFAFLPFSRDHAREVVVSANDSEGLRFDLKAGEWDVQRIDGLPPSKVTPRTPEQQANVEADWLKKQDAWKHRARGAWWLDGFAAPVEGIARTGVYGSQRFLNGEPRNPHMGVDYTADTGELVIAPAAGVVVLAEPDMYFEGGLLVVDHGAGVMGVFMHLSRLDVAVGDEVAKAQPMGAVGATGRATGPHLHWGLRVRGTYVDPELALAWEPVVFESP